MTQPPAVPPPPPPPPAPPTGGATTLDFGRAFRFFFEDPEWIQKTLIGSGMMILGFVLIGAFFLMGYWVRLVQRVARGEERPLPEWDDWGGIFGDGLRAVGIHLSYVLGALLPGILLFAAMVVLGGGLAHMARESGDSDAIGGLMSLGMMGLWGVIWLLMLVVMIYLPAALTRFALTGRFGAGFEVMENVAFIRRNILNYALSLVLYLLGSFLAQFGVLLCCVGMLPISFWTMCIFAWGLGETARLDPAQGR